MADQWTSAELFAELKRRHKHYHVTHYLHQAENWVPSTHHDHNHPAVEHTHIPHGNEEEEHHREPHVNDHASPPNPQDEPE